MVDDALADAGYVVASEYRRTVLERIGESPATPSSIADETDISIQHTSRALQELRGKDLAELLVPEERTKGRIYGPTDRGEYTLRKIDEKNL